MDPSNRSAGKTFTMEDYHKTQQKNFYSLAHDSSNSVSQSQRKVVTVAPRGGQIFTGVDKLIAEIMNENKEVPNGRRVWILWGITSVNPVYVKKVNDFLKTLRVNLDSPKLSEMDERIRCYMLSHFLEFCETIEDVNGLNGVKNFENNSLMALQNQLKDKGAIIETCHARRFLQEVSTYAVHEGGLLFHYSNFFQNSLNSSSPTNGILQFNEGHWALVEPSSMNEATTEVVLKQLEGLCAGFESKVLPMMTDEELIPLFAVVGQVMTNYVRSAVESPNLSESVFKKLNILRKQICKELDKRRNDGFNLSNLDPEIIRSLKTQLDGLRGIIGSRQFHGLYSEKEKICMLENAQRVLPAFVQFHSSIRGIHTAGWVKVAEKDDNTVSIWKINGSQHCEDELVIFCKGNHSWTQNTKGDLTSMFEGRGSEFNLNGNVHSSVIANATEAVKFLEQTLQSRRGPAQNEIGEFSKMYFVGFGYDGAIAQLLAYDSFRNEKCSNVDVIGIAVPPYMNPAAVSSFNDLVHDSEQHFGGVNLVMPGDRNQSVWGITEPLGATYRPVFPHIPVPVCPMFLGEIITGDYIKGYMQVLEDALNKHLAMRELYVKVGELSSDLQDLTSNPNRLLTGDSQPALEY